MAVIIRDADILAPHPLDIGEQLGDPFLFELVRDDESVREIFAELRRLSSGARRHVEDEKGAVVDLTVSEEVDA